MKVDWAKEADKQFELYNAGTFLVRIKDWEIIKASTGVDQIRWKAEIVEGGIDNCYVGGSIIDHCALTEKAIWRLVRFVGACGIKVKDLPVTETQSTVFNAILDECCGRRMFWDVTVEQYNGKDRNKIQDYLRDESQDEIMFQLDSKALGEEEPEFLRQL